MTASTSRAVGPVGRADALGWASVALGAPMILTPRRLLNTAGIEPDAVTTATVTAVGVRELMATLQLNVMRHRRIGMWARVAGDTMDLALLGLAVRHRRRDGIRLGATIAFIATIFTVDVVTALQLSRAESAHLQEGAGSDEQVDVRRHAGGPARIRTAITVAKPVDEVRSAFSSFAWTALDARQAEANGAVRFVAAPGARGTEVHVNLQPPVQGGTAGGLALKLMGRAPDQRISDELRRFKSLVETGVIARSEKTPAGPSTRQQLLQHPGQPEPAAT